MPQDKKWQLKYNEVVALIEKKKAGSCAWSGG
jgi:hypothetical protein